MAVYDRNDVAMIRALRAWVVVRPDGVRQALRRAALHMFAQGALTMRVVRFGVNLKCRRGGMWYDFRSHHRGNCEPPGGG